MRVADAVRRRDPDAERAARRDLAATEIERYAEQVVAKAPGLTIALDLQHEWPILTTDGASSSPPRSWYSAARSPPR
jgi:hypothetical protein